MDQDDSDNAALPNDLPAMDAQDVDENDAFTPLDFSDEIFGANDRLASHLEALGLDQYDYWGIDDLLCDGLTHFSHHDLHTDREPVQINDKHGVLSWAVSLLSCSPAASAMIAEAEAQGWNLALENLNGADYHLDVPEKLIILNDQGLLAGALGRSEYFKNAILTALIRSLRDAWQEKRHGAFEIRYNAESVLMLERFRAADLDVLSALCAWELRSEGHPSLWRYMIGGTDGDIAMRFSATLEREPSSTFSGKALSAAFTQWFRDEARINSVDHETLNYMDAIIDDCASEHFAVKGSAAFGYDKLDTLGVEILSCLPDKTAYLQGQGDEILQDPLYAGLCGAVNQAHFMQICHDLKAVSVQDVPFRDARLAAKIFPNGEFTDSID